MNKALADAQETMVKSGVDITTHPFFGKVNSDPLYKEISLKKIQSELNKATVDALIKRAQAEASKH